MEIKLVVININYLHNIHNLESIGNIVGGLEVFPNDGPTNHGHYDILDSFRGMP
jgi:hypothetical protein